MSNYIDMNYYYLTFGGDLIPQNSFNEFATRASNKVRNRIFNRDISSFENEVKNATCSVANILYNQYLNKNKIQNVINGTDKIITSEKVGDYSRNINNISINDLQVISSDESVEKEINQTIEDYLLFTGLLYAGIDYV